MEKEEEEEGDVMVSVSLVRSMSSISAISLSIISPSLHSSPPPNDLLNS